MLRDDSMFSVRYYRNSKKINIDQFIHILYLSLSYESAPDNINRNLAEFCNTLSDSLEYKMCTNPTSIQTLNIFRLSPKLIHKRKINITFRTMNGQAQLLLSEGKVCYSMKVSIVDIEKYDSIMGLCHYLIDTLDKMRDMKEFRAEEIKRRIDKFKNFAEGK